MRLGERVSTGQEREKRQAGTNGGMLRERFREKAWSHFVRLGLERRRGCCRTGYPGPHM